MAIAKGYYYYNNKNNNNNNYYNTKINNNICEDHDQVLNVNITISIHLKYLAMKYLMFQEDI